MSDVKHKEFKVSYNEMDWKFDKNDILKSVQCIVDGKEKYIDVIWDDAGAYVPNGDEKIYVLDNCE